MPFRIPLVRHNDWKYALEHTDLGRIERNFWQDGEKYSESKGTKVDDRTL